MSCNWRGAPHVSLLCRPAHSARNSAVAHTAASNSTLLARRWRIRLRIRRKRGFNVCPTASLTLSRFYCGPTKCLTLVIPPRRIREILHQTRLNLGIQLGMRQSQHSRITRLAQRAGTLLCLVLVLLASLVAVAHVHLKAQNTQDRSCSICALAHSGVVPTAVSSPSLAFASTALALARCEQVHSLLLGSSLYIRPPPAV